MHIIQCNLYKLQEIYPSVLETFINVRSTILRHIIPNPLGNVPPFINMSHELGTTSQILPDMPCQ
jgi:hypothetical protein